MTNHTPHPDLVNLDDTTLLAISVDPTITESVRGYAHADLAARLQRTPHRIAHDLLAAIMAETGQTMAEAAQEIQDLAELGLLDTSFCDHGREINEHGWADCFECDNSEDQS